MLKIAMTVTLTGSVRTFITDRSSELAGLLRVNYPNLSPDGAAALASVAALGGTAELAGVGVRGAASDGARARCPHCDWETPLRRVVSREDFSEYVSPDRSRGFIDPRDVAKFQRGIPLHFPPANCEVCGENLTLAHTVTELPATTAEAQR